METTTTAMRSNAATDSPTARASTYDDDDEATVVEMMTNNNKNKTRKTFAIVVLAENPHATESKVVPLQMYCQNSEYTDSGPTTLHGQ